MDLSDLNLLLSAPSKQIIDQVLQYVYVTRNQPIDLSDDGEQSPLQVEEIEIISTQGSNFVFNSRTEDKIHLVIGRRCQRYPDFECEIFLELVSRF